MSFKVIFLIACVLFQAIEVLSECPNACSAHGKCGAYDMCTCYRNWMANDCSQRICQFARAHVDSPKGDLDASTGKLTGPLIDVVTNSDMYPYGTNEQFPNFVASGDTTPIANTGHEYRECANKGICDRSTGTCSCFEGYEGSGCQRASCPSNANGVCSGHGTCKSIKELSAADHSNEYFLWDRDITMGCSCDSGYTGSDCSEKQCKPGFDPLYFDNGRTKRYGNFSFIFYTQDAAATIYGNYSLVFTTALGEVMQTDPIPISSTCDTITNTLEALPNNVIPSGSVRCYRSQNSKANDIIAGSKNQATGAPFHDINMLPINTGSTSTSSAINNMIVFENYILALSQNAGSIPQLTVNYYLDGKRPTLYTDEAMSTLGFKVFANGFASEEVDYVTTRCDGVTVSLDSASTYDYLTGLDTQTTKLLKICLGSSDPDTTNNVDVYNWDYGSMYNPHLIKLQDISQYAWVDYVTGPTGSLQQTNGDPQLYTQPITQLCDNKSGDQAKYGIKTVSGDAGYCSNINPAGFYAVLWFDASVARFKIYHKVTGDYLPTTKFAVFTTDGYLQLVNTNSKIFTTVSTFTQDQFVGSFYNDVVHTVNSTGTYPTYDGAIDCETSPIGTHGALDCLNKDDFVMFINPDANNGYAQNPKYMNMYTVKKIYREAKTIVPFESDPANKASEGIRNKIILNYGVNKEYQRDYSSTAFAFAYKFHPNTTTNPFGGYKYSTECSARGICDTTSGLCKCFHGYTNDNCDTQNGLAQ